MPSEEKTVEKAPEDSTTSETPAAASDSLSSTALLEQERSEKILKAKELYSHGSRNFLVKSYAEAADELSDVCSLYVELYGELSDELGMPYLLYAKSLIALALDENKVIDVPDQEDDDEEEEEEEEDEEAAGSTNGDNKVSEKNGKENGTKLESIKEDPTDSTDIEMNKKKDEKSKKLEEDSEVTSTADDDKTQTANGEAAKVEEKTEPINDGEKPSTSNGETDEVDEEENDAASNLQLAWEILELAAKIFTRQGENGLPNLAEVQTELANIEFENSILDAAREDYEKALNIYKSLPNNYRRAMAEIHYKIGLTYLMQQLNKEGAGSLKEACKLIAGEIDEIKAKSDLNDKDKNNIQDLEETKQEIEAKIIEIEETQAQNIAEVRAALDSYIKPLSSGDVDAGSSKSATAAAASLSTDGLSSSAAITSSSKPTDISHLIKRKKPEEPTSEAEAAVACSPAKRPAH